MDMKLYDLVKSTVNCLKITISSMRNKRKIVAEFELKRVIETLTGEKKLGHWKSFASEGITYQNKYVEKSVGFQSWSSCALYLLLVCISQTNEIIFM
jgi:hypothetical protein